LETIRTTTRLVTVDVVAREKDGKFAKDFKASDCIGTMQIEMSKIAN